MKKFVKVLALVLCLMLALTACGKGSYISFDDVYIDLTTDIDVLQQMLKRDGLTESDLELAAAQAREAARIDAAAMRIAREKKTETQGAHAYRKQ
jgi:ABC-type glycerol-3-phosphate transport system substrate-binding protein